MLFFCCGCDRLEVVVVVIAGGVSSVVVMVVVVGWRLWCLWERCWLSGAWC